ncbi:unnamed protein product [Lupinus luteus]|uniref:RRM domain-containing protein n=1 Tax=Lupinus luteus TaxID=3873 RepID=A0AAV1Y0T7_LUPLU
MQSNGSDSQATEQNQLQQQTPPQPQAVAVPHHWVPMQYPAAAMVMQHHMLPAQHYAAAPPSPYVPYHHHYQQQVVPAHVSRHYQHHSSSAENNTIWVGDLHHWMDENYLHRCFASTAEISSIKVIRNKQTGLSEGYGFVEFYSHDIAETVLENYAGILMPNTDQLFRLNWATFSAGDKRSDNVPHLSIFVGDLAADVTDSLLHETFSSKYPSVKAAKVVFDANNGRSKGGQGNSTSGESETDSTNTTIFVGGLDPSVTAEDLRHPFSQYGEIFSVKIPVGKGCGFVQFANRNNAEEALQKLNGTTIGKQTIRLSWGRNPAIKQFRTNFGSPWNGTYYGTPVYDGYGYAMPPTHDPSIYAATYGTYPIYGTHQQQVR